MEKRLSSCLSSCMSSWLFLTFLPKKQHLSPAKNFNLPSICVEKKSWRSALQTNTSLNFPLENSLRPREWQSQTASSLQMEIIKLCNLEWKMELWWVRISITTHYNSIHMIINCLRVHVNALCEQTTVENWRTADAAIMRCLCVKWS